MIKPERDILELGELSPKDEATPLQPTIEERLIQLEEKIDRILNICQLINGNTRPTLLQTMERLRTGILPPLRLSRNETKPPK